MRKSTYDELSAARLSEAEAARPENRFPLILILDNIRSMYNVGSIFRTADGIRAEAVYTVGYTPHPPRAEITKTALGATETVPHRHFPDMNDAIEAVRSRGYRVAALELSDEARSIYALGQKDFPLALIIGNEINGVRGEALAQVDFAISIPMLGAKHSLNVAVATGIALFECLRPFKDELESFIPK